MFARLFDDISAERAKPSNYIEKKVEKKTKTTTAEKKSRRSTHFAWKVEDVFGFTQPTDRKYQAKSIQNQIVTYTVTITVYHQQLQFFA